MKEYVRTILDYPVKGIQFRDITSLLQDAGHFKKVIDDMTSPWIDETIDAVLSIESRGFIMAGAIAYNLGAAFIPFRKPDKLPGETYKSWVDGIGYLLDAHINNQIIVYQSEVYPNTEMNEKKYREKYIKSLIFLYFAYICPLFFFILSLILAQFVNQPPGAP